jgi:VIT1/CCC1 family predicted Fe2+/Mn2+ transporter
LEQIDQSATQSPKKQAHIQLSGQDQLLVYETFMREYTALKTEQSARIGFRDNLLYVQLAAVGAVFAFATGKDSYSDSLLVIPWLSIILGWTYVVNDHHVSRLGKYVRKDLHTRMRELFPLLPEGIFNWELFHRSDTLSTLEGSQKLAAREIRKPIQFLIDWLTFVASGAVAIVMFFSKSQGVSSLEYSLVVVEASLLVLLSIAFWIYADMQVSKAIPANSKQEA